MKFKWSEQFFPTSWTGKTNNSVQQGKPFLRCKRTSENAVKDIGTWHNSCYRCSGVRCRSSAMILVFLMNGQSDSRGDALMLLALVIFCASIESFLSDHFSVKIPTDERHHECLAQLFFMFNSTMNIDLDFPRSSFFSHSSIVWHLRRRINSWLKKRQRWYQFPVDACLPPECFNWLICDALIAEASDSGDQRRLVQAENWREAISCNRSHSRISAITRRSCFHKSD